MINMAGPAIVVSYAITGVLCLIVIFAMAEMTAQHPVHGGFAASAQAYCGPLLGYLARWNVAISMTLTVGLEITAAIKYLAYWWPQVPPWIFAVALSVLLLSVNLMAVGMYGSSEYWFSMIKVIVVVAFIILGAVLILFGLPGRPATGFDNLTAEAGFVPHGLSGILIGSVAAIFSFGGSENVSMAAAEAQNPRKDIPRAARSMIARLIVFYLGSMFIIVTLQPWTTLASTTGTVKSSPFVEVLSAARLPGAADFMNFVLIIATLSAANGGLYTASRMVHSLAIDQMAPSGLSDTGNNGAPRRAVLATSVGMIIAILMAMFLPSQALTYFFGILTFTLLLTWMYIVLAHIFFKLRRERLGLPKAPVQLFGGATTSIIALVLMCAVLIYFWFDPQYVSAVVVGFPLLILVGLLYLVVPKAAKERIKRHNVLTEELATLK